ncbi:hypothetical protein CsSME_00018717 [Camellia sinensis var. sinensis]
MELKVERELAFEMVYIIICTYSLEEVDQKTKAFRASVNYAVGDNAPSLDVNRVSKKGWISLRLEP